LVALVAVVAMTAGASASARAQAPPTPPTTRNVLEELLVQLLTPSTVVPVPTAAAAPP